MAYAKPKISIIGCGNVGMRYACALIIKGLARHIVLVDVDREKAEGEMMDLTHASAYTSPVDIIAGNYSDTKGSDLVVITAGKHQKKGESRIDLAKANIDIFKKIIPSIMENSPDSIILIVSNPVDILSYAAYKISSKPSREVFGSGTTLDTARLKSEIAKHCEIYSQNIHAYILGEHGDSEVPIWSRAMIGGLLFKDYCPICRKYKTCNMEKELKDIFKNVKNSAYEIINKKGETSYGIGLSLARITRAIINDENTILPVSTLVDDYFGLNDLYFSLPAVVNGSGLRETIKLKVSEEEKNKLVSSGEVLKKVIIDSGL